MENIRVKVTVNTPRNQAQRCIETQKRALLGNKATRQIVSQKVEAHNRFHWILSTTTDDVPNITHNAARGEAIIKKFYAQLIKWIGRANKLAQRSSKALNWTRRWLTKRITAAGQTDFADQIRNMSDDDLKELIRIDDLKEMQQLLSGDLITIEEVKPNGIQKETS